MQAYERKTIQELFALATGIVDRLNEDVLAGQSLRRTPVAYGRIAERAADKARQLRSLCDAILVIAASDTTGLAGGRGGKRHRAKN